jgi:hypothetical protein
MREQYFVSNKKQVPWNQSRTKRIHVLIFLLSR